ncbi:MAG: mandelate racemase/muconate lactonizing enzyme family protein [Planctomycetota bacterium]|jgi:L-alanine-DL-glutamate epimerase-like enolase superfamily enzyme
MNTKIKKIILRRCDFQHGFKGTYTNGDQDPDILKVMVGEIICGDNSGFGECIPTSIYYEKGHIGRADIEEWDEIQKLAQGLIGYDTRKLSNWIPEEIRNNHDFNSIVDVLDFAIYDLLGKTYNIPVQILIGGGRREVDKINVIHVQTPDEMSDEILEDYKKDGVRYFKLKPNGNLELDKETLIKINEKLPEKVHIYEDPNYALQVDGIEGTIEYLNEMHKYGLEVCEDPIKATFEEYKKIKESTPVKLMLDEPARSPERVMEIVRLGCADIVNIHANWSGGFRPGLLKAQLAAVGNIGTMIGSSNYMGIGCTAYQTLSSVLPIDMPCEQSSAKKRSLVKEEYTLKDGKLIIPDKPGLGIEVDMEKLESCVVEKIEID